MKAAWKLLMLVVLLWSCGEKKSPPPKVNHTPIVRDSGAVIGFPDSSSVRFFKVETVKKENLSSEITAPGKVAASILPSSIGGSQHIVLFENSDLASNYSLLVQHQVNMRQIQNVNIRQKEIELGRIKDLNEHGAATGKDLLEAQTALAVEQANLANEKAALIEHETKLKAGGFDPDELRNAPPQTVYIICDIPESQMGKLHEGGTCHIRFTSFPNETLSGKIDALADVVDNTTRMVKIRIILKNPDNRLKAGMFALVSFGVAEGFNISVRKTALITVQGQNYVFVKKGSSEFDRREVGVGHQIGDRVVIYSGLMPEEKVAVDGVIQLKGLSFGY